MKKILLSVFDPFGGSLTNGTQAVALHLQERQFEGGILEIIHLPVERHRSFQLLQDAIESFQPDFVIMLGEAGGRVAVTPERIAINVDDFRIADNGGHQPNEEPTVADAPAGYFSTLPLALMVKAMVDAEVPAEISNTAGTFVCNHLFYSVMHALAGYEKAPRAGFIHIPLLDENKSSGVPEWNSLPLSTVARGVEVIIETCIHSN